MLKRHGQSILCILVMLFCVVIISVAQASPLPAKEAFSVEAGVMDESVMVRVSMPDGYYLYRDSISFSHQDGSEVSFGFHSAGERHVDEFFGEVRIYRNAVYFTVFSGDINKLNIHLQGCLEKTLCYPPVIWPLQ